MKTEIRRHSEQAPWTYRALDARQREIARAVREGGEGVLLLSEVAPVITRGRRAPDADLRLTPEEFAERGIEIYEVGRGGFATYHGPGQWVLFVVESLERLTGDRRGVRRAVEGLLAVARDAVREWQPASEIRHGCELGVWSPAGKLSALGIEIEQGVLLHGIAVNGICVAPAFEGLRPCGLDAPVAYALADVSDSDRAKAFERLGERLLDRARHEFNL